MESVKRLLADWVEQGVIPGAALRVVNRDGLICAYDAGRTSLPDGQPMTPDTLFDLASLTKVTATLPAVLLLMQEGRLALDDSVGRFFPDCPADKRSITIEQLLTHTSGLAADAAERRRDGHIRLPELLYRQPLLQPPGERVVYSDLGMIWLGLLVVKLTGEPLDRYVKRRVFDPLGMRHTCFRPDLSIFRNIASTEFCRLTNRFITGEVHDNAVHLGRDHVLRRLRPVLHDAVTVRLLPDLT
jgi:serine-type D-Ala-D-Ala carboxypeptidase